VFDSIDFSLDGHLGARTIYPPIGYCIYCYAHNGKLTDEHTIPDGLGGRHILAKASCEKCQRVINPVETYCLRTMLGNLRAAEGIKSSKKRPRPPYSITVKRKNQAIEKVFKPLRELPIICAMPVWPNPFILSGLPAPDSFMGAQWVYNPNDMKRVLSDFNAESIISENLDPMKFARMIAKIAHSHTVAVMGLESFQPLLPPLILGYRRDYIDLVGGVPEEHPSLPQASLTMSFQTAHQSDGKIFGIFNIRLFANLGGPIYRVVVGELKSPWPDKL
jgi:hypothetical protein